MKTYTQNQTVWITSPERLRILGTEDAKKLFRNVHLDEETREELHCMEDTWIYVGEAITTITITESSETTHVVAIEQLREIGEKLKAETQIKLNAIQEEISKLQSIEYTP